MANLTKKYKNAKDKLRSTGYGRGGDEADHEKPAREMTDDMEEPRQVVDPRHVLESSMPPCLESESEEIERELLEKEALDDEILSAAERQTRTGSGSSGECSAQASHNSSDD